MFARELASIKDLEEQERAANKITIAAKMPESTSIVDPFSGLFDLLLPLVLAALPIFLNLPKCLWAEVLYRFPQIFFVSVS